MAGLFLWLDQSGPPTMLFQVPRPILNKGTFGQIVENFYHQVLGLIEGGADVLLIETQQDILETKAIIAGANKAFAEKKRTTDDRSGNG